jgi:crotonobetainyl-CoA:carnitine CoA-transferase CaiB-like acyl-CoA transferase
MGRLDLAYPVLQASNPRIVYASSTGYGLGGRYQDLPAMDLTVQAMVGVLSVTGFPESPPVKAGVAIADFMAGVHMYAGIVTALFQRERVGRGARIDVSMFDATLPAMLSSLAMALGTQDENPTRTGNRHGGLAEAPYNVFPTADSYVAIICVSEHQWVALAEVMGRPELAMDEKFISRAARVENIDALDEAIAAWTSTKSRETVVDLLLGRGIPVAPVRTLREVVEDPDLETRGVLRHLNDAAHGPVRVISSPIRYDGGESVAPRSAPALDEHNAEVFEEWLGSRTGVGVGTGEGA